MPWESGTKIFGDRYKIIKILGQGGFGITYLVENSQGSTLVLKTVKDEILIDRRYSNRRDKYLLEFEKEASKLAICRHHHIVKIDNHFSVNYSIEGNNNSWNGSLPCIVMEYIAGKDLLDLVEEEGKLSEVEAVSYIQQIGDALKLIHSKGLLHRDIKPHNIMKRDNKQEVVLIDFGIARQFIPNINQVMTTFATDGFAPVEQYDEYGRKGEYTDIYALSATLYYLLTKKIPRTSLLRRKDKKWDKLKPLNKIISVSDRVHEAVMKGLAVEPEDRPQTLKEWLEMFVSKEIIYLDNQQPEKDNTFTNLKIKDEVISQIDADIIALRIKYKRLQLLLANQEWKKADQETTKIMLRITHRETTGWLDFDSIKNLSCEDFLTIDKLWLKYSNGRFGFSIQKDIWLKCGDKLSFHGEKTLGDRLGWRKNGEWINYDHLIFSISAPIGQFPRVWCGLSHWGMACALIKAFLNCNLLTKDLFYQKLEKLLANSQWREADQETAKIIFEVVGRLKESWLNPEAINNFPCEDLLIIDKLWLKYSNGRFGFSIQKNIWLECGGKLDDQTECQLGDLLGWRKNGEWLQYNQFIFDSSAPLGHFPCPWGKLVEGRVGYTSSLLSRMVQCDSLAEQNDPDFNQYQKLEQLLANNQWKEANQETVKIMLKIANREKEGWFDTKSIDNFQIKDLQIIDKLWIQHSNGRFGFSIQKKIWLECGGNYKIEKELAARLGWMIIDGEWINYDNQVNYNISAPLGHLPFKYGYYGKVGGVLDPVWILWIQEKLES